MPFFRRKGVKRTPGAYGESVPKRQRDLREESTSPGDTNNIDYWKEKYPNSQIVTCYRCGQQFLIAGSPSQFRLECFHRWGVNVILDDICGETVRGNDAEKKKLNDRLRKEARG